MRTCAAARLASVGESGSGRWAGERSDEVHRRDVATVDLMERPPKTVVHAGDVQALQPAVVVHRILDVKGHLVHEAENAATGCLRRPNGTAIERAEQFWPHA